LQDKRKSLANSLIEHFQDVAEGKRALSIDYILDKLDWSSERSQETYLDNLIETLFEVALKKQVIPDVYYPRNTSQRNNTGLARKTGL
jgi:hypothetical protein